MNILLIYPQCPDSFWSFKNALKFIAKKAAVPPLGLITVSAMLPSTWQKKLVDLNVSTLHQSDVIWADLVFLSAMYIQKESVGKVISMCLKWQTKIVAGGPLFTQEYMKYPQIDHFVLNEAEITLPPFLNDLKEGTAERIYQTEDYADISQTPVPDYHLLSVKDYAFMNIQVTRGCPFACSFCEITSLLGHKVRMKKTSQIIDELNVLYHQIKWRGPVSIVDDNFIGNKSVLKSSLLPAMKKWMQAHRFPFSFNIETSINLADDPELLKQLVETGFNSTFIGIETPDEESLHYCNKVQNKNRDLLESIRIIQNGGMQVSAGFIVGFDSDTPSVFQRQIDFIQQSGIVSAMVGLLNAPKNTPLYRQLKAENRLLEDPTGNNTDMSVNFITKMDRNDLLKGYKHIVHSIYSIKPYYQRLRKLLLSYNPRSNRATKINFSLFRAFLKSVLILGLLNKGRRQYWKLLTWTLFKRPSAMVSAITYAVYGYHYRKVYGLQN